MQFCPRQTSEKNKCEKGFVLPPKMHILSKRVCARAIGRERIICIYFFLSILFKTKLFILIRLKHTPRLERLLPSIRNMLVLRAGFCRRYSCLLVKMNLNELKVLNGKKKTLFAYIQNFEIRYETLEETKTLFHIFFHHVKR